MSMVSQSKFPIQRQKGFTLIEILVAMAITALIGVAAIQTLNQATTSKASVERNSKRFNNLERAFFNIAQDILQISTRNRRNEYGDFVAAVQSSDNEQYPFLALTKIGRRNPANLARSAVESVRYQLEDHILYRYSFPQTDGMSLEQALKRDLLDKVENLKISFYDGEQWTNNWPALDFMAPVSSFFNPLAIKVTVELEDLGIIERLFVIPDPEQSEAHRDEREDDGSGGRSNNDRGRKR